MCCGGWQYLNPTDPGSNQLTSSCYLRGSSGDRISQRHSRCGREQPGILEGDVLVSIRRRLKSFLCGQKSLCFAHGGGCCCKQTSVSQGGGNSAGMTLSREVLKSCGSREGEEQVRGFLCRPGCDEAFTDQISLISPQMGLLAPLLLL